MDPAPLTPQPPSTPQPGAPGVPTVPVQVRRADEVPYALIGLLSYCNVLALVPLFVCAPKSFEKFHSLQGTALFLLVNVTWGIAAYALPPAYGSVLFACAAVLHLVLTVIGTRNVLRGLREPLPLVGDLTRLLHLND